MHHRHYYAFLWLLYTLVVYKANAKEDCTIANSDEECTSTTTTNSESEDLDRGSDNNKPTLTQLKATQKMFITSKSTTIIYITRLAKITIYIQIIRRRHS